jgi:hypothetical protein
MFYGLVIVRFRRDNSPLSLLTPRRQGAEHLLLLQKLIVLLVPQLPLLQLSAKLVLVAEDMGQRGRLPVLESPAPPVVPPPADAPPQPRFGKKRRNSWASIFCVSRQIGATSAPQIWQLDQSL